MSLIQSLITEISKGKEKFIIKNTLNRLRKLDIGAIRDERGATFYADKYSDYDEGFFKQVRALIQSDFLNVIERTDPTSKINGEYGVWLSKIFTKHPYIKEFLVESGAMNVLDISRITEDIGKINKYLKAFHYLKERNMVSNNDINSYKEVSELFDEVKDHLTSDLLTNKGQIMKESEIIYDDGTWKIVVPKTYEASCHWGSGTNWCTAVDDGDSTTFDNYNNDGNLYIFIKEQGSKKEKYQMFVDYTFDFMNAKDEEALDEFISSARLSNALNMLGLCFYYEGKEKYELDAFEFLNDLSGLMVYLSEATREKLLWVDFIPNDSRFMMIEMLEDIYENRKEYFFEGYDPPLKNWSNASYEIFVDNMRDINDYNHKRSVLIWDLTEEMGGDYIIIFLEAYKEKELKKAFEDSVIEHYESLLK